MSEMEYCDCLERVKRAEFVPCRPEHQPMMDVAKKVIEEIVRKATVLSLTKLARGFIDDELVLSEDVLIEK
jgi:hypothetical protein